jgi:acetate kinase
METILVVNAGSSSVKFQVFAAEADRKLKRLIKGQMDGIGTRPRLRASDANGNVMVERSLASAEVADVPAALRVAGAWLRDAHDIKPLAVGHRVVHGGPRFTGPVRVTPEVMQELRRLVPLAPLHQPHNLAAIEAVAERIPDVPQVACFDTSFHRGHSPVAELVPLPRDIVKHGVQRYGFHGLSYESIASILPSVAPSIARGRVIVAHLGSGASLCAMQDLKSVDSTLGFTALDGLCMGTRPGALDPGIVLYLFQSLGLDAKRVEKMLYKESGLLGISGISNDMRDLLASDAPEAALAVDYFVFRAAKEMGALAAVLGGVDGLVFTAGIGENSAAIRKRLCDASAWLGVGLDAAANEGNAPLISKPGSRVEVRVVPTDEELMIARHTAEVLGLQGPVRTR